MRRLCYCHIEAEKKRQEKDHKMTIDFPRRVRQDLSALIGKIIAKERNGAAITRQAKSAGLGRNWGLRFSFSCEREIVSSSPLTFVSRLDFSLGKAQFHFSLVKSRLIERRTKEISLWLGKISYDVPFFFQGSKATFTVGLTTSKRPILNHIRRSHRTYRDIAR